jgi:ATP-dependent exoDNAse (exonuclease V) alpha subunit
MDIKFSPQQTQAMKAMREWYKSDHRRPFIINGFAGTGKTTIAKHIGDTLGFDQSKVIYTAFTGKAASQLRKKGCDDATTIHKLLYKPINKGSKKLDDLKENLAVLERSDPKHRSEASLAMLRLIKEEQKYLKEASFESAPDEDRINRSKIIVVDESSMVTEKMVADMASTGLPVIYCGDPFQLPPVKGRSPLGLIKPDILLSEVHRQALDSPVLRFATNLREGKWFDYEARKELNGDQELSIVPKSMAGYELYDSHDQIICASNATRLAMNAKIQRRKIIDNIVKPIECLLPDKHICINDRIIFLANDYENEIFNGIMGTVSDVKRPDPSDARLDFPHLYWEITGSTEDVNFQDYLVYNEFITHPKTAERRRTQMVDLAYSITAHKSQGSEWDSVIVHFESLRDNNMARWLYSAVTRARLRCTIVVPEELR